MHLNSSFISRASLAQRQSNYDKRHERFCSAPKKLVCHFVDSVIILWDGVLCLFPAPLFVCLFRASSVSTNDGFRHRLCLITLWARCLWIYDVIKKRRSNCDARPSP